MQITPLIDVYLHVQLFHLCIQIQILINASFNVAIIIGLLITVLKPAYHNVLPVGNFGVID